MTKLAMSTEETVFLSKKDRKAEKVKLFLLEKKTIKAGKHTITKIEDFKGIGITITVDGEKLSVVNPPLKVPDGTTYEEEIDGEMVTMNNMKFSPKDALIEIVLQYYASKK